MADVHLQSVRKTYPNGFEAVKEFNLKITDGEFVVFVGPSGCGKSTTLRMIAGLEDISSGTIAIGGRVVNDVHPKDRDIAMVFQNYALYPHMTVYKNMAFALQLRGVKKDEIDRRVRSTASMLGIQELLDRKPKVLSGGQRQRVAVGRAIVREPKAFLFDEPLSNLDAKLRVSTRAELKGLHQRLKTTTVYVTHDQEEAMTLGDRIVVMSNGLIQQADSPLQVYNHPANRFVAGFVGTPPMNFIEGTLEGAAAGVMFVERGSSGTRLPLSAAHAAKLSSHVGTSVVLGVRPQYLTLDATRSPAIDLTVNVVEPLGDQMDLSCVTGAGSRVVVRTAASSDVRAGDSKRFAIDVAKLHVFEPGEFGTNLTL